jgi:hypothetical protein
MRAKMASKDAKEETSTFLKERGEADKLNLKLRLFMAAPSALLSLKRRNFVFSFILDLSESVRT